MAIDLVCNRHKKIQNMSLRKGVVTMEWISVKDRLPDTDGYYLCVWNNCIDIFEFAKNLYKVDKYSFTNKKGKSGFYECDREWGFIEHEDVTHWMPLPELPKENDNAE